MYYQMGVKRIRVTSEWRVSIPNLRRNILALIKIHYRKLCGLTFAKKKRGMELRVKKKSAMGKVVRVISI